MEFCYTVKTDRYTTVKHFLKEEGFSKGLLAKVKFQGGAIYVNQKSVNVLAPLHKNDRIVVVVPKEDPHETVLTDNTPLDILFEDEHFLIVNKPFGVASIPAQYHPNGTMANRVKHYYVKHHYENQVVHIVTRLDRDTTGVMLFAKHGFAHALLDQQLRKKTIKKTYLAYVEGKVETLSNHGQIKENIVRDQTSLLKRKVSPSEGKFAHTEYWLEEKTSCFAKVRILLHTGRTHQIRVHFAHIGCPLVGDELYGKKNTSMIRQALHCQTICFWHPFLKKQIIIQAPLPQDFKQMEERMNE